MAVGPRARSSQDTSSRPACRGRSLADPRRRLCRSLAERGALAFLGVFSAIIGACAAAEYKAGFAYAIKRGWPELHEGGTFAFLAAAEFDVPALFETSMPNRQAALCSPSVYPCR